MTTETRFSPGPWRFERMESAVEFAALKGQALEEHEGYFRDNNGDWIVMYGDPETDAYGRVAGISFQGTAKRGQAYGAPDPIGQANAHLIAAAPDMYEAIERMLNWRLPHDRAFTVTEGSRKAFDGLLAALAKARGEAS